MAVAARNPLIAIVGATGTGKSDLAVEIAKRFNGEIINGDAMQLYRGLPVVTNKITEEEMRGVPHHLLGCIGLEEETWTVGKFVGKALRVIDEIRSRGKLPILVGGTHYYTQSLLFKDALADEPGLNLEKNGEINFPILAERTEVIHDKLKEVDPIMADRWHPNERRKIQRSLEIYLRTGKPASQVYKEQRKARGRSPSGSEDDQESERTGMRFPTLVMWVHADKDILRERLDRRVDKMIDRGLLEEASQLTAFRQAYEERTEERIDQSRGIWVSIGYKEFLNYHAALLSSSHVGLNMEHLKSRAIEKTQAATRQYANRQIKWIRIKLLNALIEAGCKRNMFLLDGSDLSKWNGNVIDPASKVTQQFLHGETLPEPSSLSGTAAEMLNPKRNYDLGQRPDLWHKRECKTCGTVAVTENDWTLHVKSRAHRRAVGIKKKQESSDDVSNKERPISKEDVVDVLESYMQSMQSDENATWVFDGDKCD